MRSLPCLAGLSLLLGCTSGTGPTVPCDDPVPLLGRHDPAAPGYLVALESTLDVSRRTAELASEYGFRPTSVWPVGLKGFAAIIPASTAQALRCEAGVLYVQHDQIVTLDSKDRR